MLIVFMLNSDELFSLVTQGTYGRGASTYEINNSNTGMNHIWTQNLEVYSTVLLPLHNQNTSL